jgi:hypothetical protein
MATTCTRLDPVAEVTPSSSGHVDNAAFIADGGAVVLPPVTKTLVTSSDVAARAPGLTKLQALGQDVSLVLEPEAGCNGRVPPNLQ